MTTTFSVLILPARIIRHRMGRIQAVCPLAPPERERPLAVEPLYYQWQPPDPFNVTTGWAPHADVSRGVAQGLTAYRIITVYHKHNNPCIMYPTVAEVLSQIPHDGTTVAYEILHRIPAPFPVHRLPLACGFRLSDVVLYQKIPSTR